MESILVKKTKAKSETGIYPFYGQLKPSLLGGSVLFKINRKKRNTHALM